MHHEKETLDRPFQLSRNSPLGQQLEDYQSVVGLTADMKTRMRIKELLEDRSSDLYHLLNGNLHEAQVPMKLKWNES